MKLSYLSVFCGLLLTLFGGCKKADKGPVLKAAKLISFTLKQVNNPNSISADLKAEIIGDDINITVSKGTDLTKAIASFEFDGKQILLNKIVQVSGVTRNDFTQETEYEITGEDGKKRNYELKLNWVDDAELVLDKFWLDRTVNQGLIANIDFTMKEDSVLANAAELTGKLLKPSFTSNASEVLINNVKAQTGVTAVNFANPVVVTLVSSKGFRKNYQLKVTWINEVPHFFITTVNNTPLINKDDELSATLVVDGKGRYANMNSSTKIKGRGNSTWNYPKKPYRLKFDSKTSVLGLPKAKKWVLLANYIDPTSMLNSVALKMGQLLKMPYTNNFIPVEVTLNGTYLGAYLLTEQVEVDDNRVNIGSDGVLIEMDSYFDEDYKFKSAKYQLPVMIKYPELKAQSEVVPIQADFQAFEDLVYANTFPNNNYLSYFDKDSFVNFVLVTMMADNEEINHPKSTYMYKTNGGKYNMGPLWDFDWAWGYEGSGKHFSTATRPLFNSSFTGKPGYNFFGRLMTDPAIRTAFKAKWQAFKAGQLADLKVFIDDYAKLIQTSKARDYAVWKNGDAVFMNDVAKLKKYIDDRANYIDTYVSGF
jgi:hypothetical protein